jgi:hypothetical protein
MMSLEENATTQSQNAKALNLISNSAQSQGPINVLPLPTRPDSDSLVYSSLLQRQQDVVFAAS